MQLYYRSGTVADGILYRAAQLRQRSSYPSGTKQDHVKTLIASFLFVNCTLYNTFKQIFLTIQYKSDNQF